MDEHLLLVPAARLTAAQHSETPAEWGLPRNTGRSSRGTLFYGGPHNAAGTVHKVTAGSL